MVCMLIRSKKSTPLDVLRLVGPRTVESGSLGNWRDCPSSADVDVVTCKLSLYVLDARLIGCQAKPSCKPTYRCDTTASNPPWIIVAALVSAIVSQVPTLHYCCKTVTQQFDLKINTFFLRITMLKQFQETKNKPKNFQKI